MADTVGAAAGNLLSCLGAVEEPGDVAEPRRSRNSPRIILLEELKRIQSHDVVLPSAANGQIATCAA
jgi:hypothetical protein